MPIISITQDTMYRLQVLYKLGHTTVKLQQETPFDDYVEAFLVKAITPGDPLIGATPPPMPPSARCILTLKEVYPLMSEWDKLCEEMNHAMYHTRLLKDQAEAWVKIKTEGDSLQAKNKQQRESINTLKKISQDVGEGHQELDDKLGVLRKLDAHDTKYWDSFTGRFQPEDFMSDFREGLGDG